MSDRTKEKAPTVDYDNEDTTVVFLLCAGENDVSSGARTEQILEGVAESLRQAVHRIFHDRGHDAPPTGAPPPGPGSNIPVDARRRLVLLGPKLEPWLTDDVASRERYAALDLVLRGTCGRLDEALGGGTGTGTDGGGVGRFVAYVDCMTAFCEQREDGEWKGECVPDGRYFEGDGLHLGLRGYAVWKGLVEATVEGMLRVTEGKG